MAFYIDKKEESKALNRLLKVAFGLLVTVSSIIGISSLRDKFIEKLMLIHDKETGSPVAIQVKNGFSEKTILLDSENIKKFEDLKKRKESLTKNIALYNDKAKLTEDSLKMADSTFTEELTKTAAHAKAIEKQ